MDSESDEHSGHHNRDSKKIRIMDDGQCSSDSTPTPESKRLPFDSLPFELNTEIFSRLPVKSLLDCKRVAKSWLSFMGSREFIKAHLAASSKNGECAYHKLIFTPIRLRENLKACSLRSAVSEPNAEVFDINCPGKSQGWPFWVVGYCQGLVCYAIRNEDLFLWNPTTGKFKKLPDLNFKVKDGGCLFFGFGHDEKNDDYKVVGIFGDGCEKHGGGDYEAKVQVYSLNNDSWRTEDYKGGVPLDGSGKYANGKLHWPASRNSFSGRPFGFPRGWKITSLDLADETYGEIDLPVYGEDTDDWAFGVLDNAFGEVGGCLAVLCNYQKIRADLWVIKEYGSHESWTRLVSISFLNGLDYKGYSKPLCMLKNGEILLDFGATLVLYNKKQNSFRYLLFNNLAAFEAVGTYVESLVSPNSCDGAERQHQ